MAKTPPYIINRFILHLARKKLLLYLTVVTSTEGGASTLGDGEYPLYYQ